MDINMTDATFHDVSQEALILLRNAQKAIISVINIPWDISEPVSVNNHILCLSFIL